MYSQESKDKALGMLRLTGNVGKAARMSGIPGRTLRRWAQEYEAMGDGAFPGNGSPRINKDYEIVKPRKKIDELESTPISLTPSMPPFGLGQYNGHGESSVSIGKVFKLCQENATADNSSSPPRDWFSRKRSQPRGCPTGQTCRAAPSEGGRRNMRPTARTRSPEAATPSRTRIARY